MARPGLVIVIYNCTKSNQTSACTFQNTHQPPCSVSDSGGITILIRYVRAFVGALLFLYLFHQVWLVIPEAFLSLIKKRPFIPASSLWIFCQTHAVKFSEVKVRLISTSKENFWCPILTNAPMLNVNELLLFFYHRMKCIISSPEWYFSFTAVDF